MENKKVRVSVAMTTYNGEKYIKEQIDSILNNLDKDDELIISDDGSKDNTISIIKEYLKKDSRIKFINGPKNGIKQNFANSIQECKGEYIFLSDQDDIWLDNKVEEVLKTFRDEQCILIVHNTKIIDEKKQPITESFFEYRKSGKGIFKNIYKNTYIGCCMAFKNTLKDKILPIPNNIEMHDQWIGIIAEMTGKVFFLNKTLLLYRRHDANNSKLRHYGIKKMIRNRIVLISELLKRK